ncbi:phage N-6-adenine-methyltransferase [Escherichia coli DEC9B]|nr:phage N-6-adenine-methyltransferase [Escherichia coli DEC9B]
MNGHNEKVGLHDYQIKYTSTRQGLLAKRRFGFLMRWILSLDSGWIQLRATKMLCALTG